jgi:hexulose-6-phosphate isomerase
MHSLSRRQFLGTAAVLATGATFADDKAPKLRFAVKYGMIKSPGSTLQKFELAKKVGFEGVEIDSPSNVNKDEAVRARDETGIKIHGVIDSKHWDKNYRLSSPDAAARERGLAVLKGAIDDARLFGAETVLLVPGVVDKDATYEECWARSQAEVRKAIPHAEKAGVRIAIEVVWNNFITKPEQLLEYVDSFESPYVGAYFDSSNMIKYGVPSAEWIRKLGKRMLKFDLKGFSKAKQWVPIGEGDEDWPAIRKALNDIGYQGWATAEVDAGGEDHLRDVYRRMAECLGRA